MTETMGQIIKRLRKEHNLTQEELAEQLNISAPAVSKWENDTSMPDISQVVPLANLFGVSTDILFSRNVQKNNEAVKELVDKIRDDENLDNYSKIQQLKELLIEYPSNMDILYNIVWCSWFLITPEQANSTIFHDAIHSADLYLNNTKKLGDFCRMYGKKIDIYVRAGRYSEAEELAQDLDRAIIDSEMYLARINGERGNYNEEIRHEQESVTLLLGWLAHELDCLAIAYRNNGEFEKALEVNSVNLSLVHTFHKGDGLHVPLYNYYHISGFEAAFELVEIGRHDEAIDMLEKIFDYGEIQCNLCTNHARTESPVFDNIDLTPYHGKLKLSDYLWKITRSEFEPLHKYERFQALLERYKKYED